jgi:hypothetical protein
MYIQSKEQQHTQATEQDRQTKWTAIYPTGSRHARRTGYASYIDVFVGSSIHQDKVVARVPSERLIMHGDLVCRILVVRLHIPDQNTADIRDMSLTAVGVIGLLEDGAVLSVFSTCVERDTSTQPMVSLSVSRKAVRRTNTAEADGSLREFTTTRAVHARIVDTANCAANAEVVEHSVAVYAAEEEIEGHGNCAHVSREL